jgi:Zn-dependent peptidase ImmA (M78 family)
MQDFRRKEIQRQANLFREKCKVGRYGILNLFKECDRNGFKLLRYPLGEDGILGFSMKKDDDIIIFTNTSCRLSREIFTLAHEIGHAILHVNDTASFIDDTITISGKFVDEKEQEANFFAACLLMPSSKIEDFLDSEIENFNNQDLTAMDIARIMSEFNVSFEMVLNRLEHLGKINSSEKIRLDTERVQKSVGRLLKSVGGNSQLNEISKEISIPYEFLNYVIYNYNHKSIPLETLEKVLSYYNLTIDDVNDKLVDHSEDEDDLDELIGRLAD